MSAHTSPCHDTNTTYFFTFGDSYSQTDFDVHGEQPSHSNPMGNPPLGQGTSAGGINWVGYLTTVDNNPNSLVLSYNLAVGGATIDNRIVAAYPFDLVYKVFEFHTRYGGKPADAPWTSETAVFSIWIGINDIGISFISTDADVLVPKLLARYLSLVELLYADGARKFLFINVPAVSRSPAISGQGPAVETKHAAYVDVYNRELEEMVRYFEASHHDVTTVLYDSWSFMTRVMDNLQAYGFRDSQRIVSANCQNCMWHDDLHPSSMYHRLQAADMRKYLQVLGPW